MNGLHILSDICRLAFNMQVILSNGRLDDIRLLSLLYAKKCIAGGL